jgi:hypothetical protein
MKLKEVLKLILSEKDNLTAKEIHTIILSKGIIIVKGKTPEATISRILSAYSDNSNVKSKYKKKLFIITSTSPNRYSLIKEEYELTENDLILKYLIDKGVRCLKIEDKDGEELESVYLNEDDYTCFYKTTKKLADKNEVFMDKFIKLLIK